MPGGDPRAAYIRVKRPSERRSASRSASRALDVLECFGARREPLRAHAIAAMLGMRASSADQLLKTMVGSGHLVFDDAAKTYLPSPRLAPFARWTEALYGASDIHALVATVRNRTGLLATLATPNGLFMQVLAAAEADGIRAERGISIALFGSALGTAWLATLTEDAIVAFADRARLSGRETARALTEIARARANGYAATASEDGTRSLAVAVPGDQSGVSLILGLAGPDVNLAGREDDLATMMHAAIADWPSRCV